MKAARVGMVSIFLLAAAFVLPQHADAAYVIASQSASQFQITSGYSVAHDVEVPLGTGLNSFPQYGYLYALRESSASAGTAPSVSLRCFTDAGYSSGCTQNTLVSTTATAMASSDTKTQISFDFATSTAQFDATKYYQLRIDWSSLPSGGSPSAGFRAYLYGTDAATPSTMYYLLYGSAGSNLGTRILDETLPYSNQVTGSSNVEFKYTYYFDSADFGTTTQACVDAIDVSVSQQANVPCSPIIASGQSTYDITVPLNSGHAYMWRAYLADTNGVARVTGQYVFFNVVSTTGGASYIPGLDPNLSTSTGTSSLQSTGLAFLNLPSLLTTRYPFAYIPQVFSAVQSQATLSGPATFPSLSITYNITGNSTTSLDVFSTTSISNAVGTTNMAAIRNVFNVVLWFEAVMVWFWLLIGFIKKG